MLRFAQLTVDPPFLRPILINADGQIKTDMSCGR